VYLEDTDEATANPVRNRTQDQADDIVNEEIGGF